MKPVKMMLILLPSLLLAGCYVEDDGYYGGGTNPPPCTNCNTTTERISQWASDASASSDGMPGSTDFSAIQATGAPDVMACGDDARSWSPAAAQPMPGTTQNGDTVDDFIVTTFPNYVWVHEVQIYESYNPGAIVEVDLEASDDSVFPTVLWQDFSGDGYAPCPASFTIDVNQDTTYDQYDRVVVYLDSNLVGDANGNGNPNDDYNEIDAVGLVGDELVYY